MSTTANMLFTNDSIDSAKSATLHKETAGNVMLEELGVFFRDQHKAIFSAKVALLLPIARSQRLNLRFQNLTKICS